MLSAAAEWRSTVGCRATSPYKDPPPLLRVPGLVTAAITTDPLHSFHLGWGQDLAASAIVLLAKRQAFGIGGLDTKLEAAFSKFMEFCDANGRTTGCEMFSKQTFDMKPGST